MRLRVEEVQGHSCLTNFWGMSFTTDKLRSLVLKWQSLIEAHVDVKTTDGYMLRLFCIGFTRKRQGQTSKACYCQVLPYEETSSPACGKRSSLARWRLRGLTSGLEGPRYPFKMGQ